jgi:hypothetical protein
MPVDVVDDADEAPFVMVLLAPLVRGWPSTGLPMVDVVIFEMGVENAVMSN